MKTLSTSAWATPICRRYQVELDADTEAIVTIGAKEGLSHLAWATIDPGDVVLCPSPTYPIHQYAVVLAGGDLRCIPLTTSEAFFGYLDEAISCAAGSVAARGKDGACWSIAANQSGR